MLKRLLLQRLLTDLNHAQDDDLLPNYLFQSNATLCTVLERIIS